MGRRGRFLLFIAMLSAAATVSGSSSAFRLNPEDERLKDEVRVSVKEEATDDRDSAASAPDVSRPEPTVKKRFGDLRQAKNTRRGPAAAAPPVRLLPGVPPPGSLPLSAPPSEDLPPMPTTVVSSTSTTSSFIAAAAPSITGVRLGQHYDKTRVVLDVSGKPDFSYKISESGTSVIFNFPQVDWRSDRPSRRLTGLVAGYSFDRGNKGEGLLNIETRMPVNVRKVFVLPPENKQGYRIVLDLAQGRSAVR